jgi:hypothetical protein
LRSLALRDIATVLLHQVKLWFIPVKTAVKDERTTTRKKEKFLPLPDWLLPSHLAGGNNAGECGTVSRGSINGYAAADAATN